MNYEKEPEARSEKKIVNRQPKTVNHMTNNDNIPKASLVTLGCPMNQVDSERIISGLVERGFDIVPEEEADVIVVNTCGFIESAREESIEAILSVADLKKNGNLKALVVAGCLAQRYKTELEKDLKEADAIVCLDDVESIPEYCSVLLKHSKHGVKSYSRTIIGSPYTAYLKIAEGCNNRCSFCAIPMIRGPFRSMAVEDILKEAGELSALGIKELVLIGQDTSNFGSDLDSEKNLPWLLEKLNDYDGIEWIRLLYAHPAHFSEEFIEAFNGLPKVLPYLDMPLQHISEKLLKIMGRQSKPEKIRKLLDTLRERVDGLVLRTSLIVGFPGETEKDFRELIEFIERYRFERLGAFVYSPEEGTPAALMGEKVPKDVAQERYETLMEIQRDISADFQESLVGREFDMIVDEIDPDTSKATGRTYMDAPEIDGNVSVVRGVEEGSAFYRVRITGAEAYDLVGEVVND